MSMDHWSWTLWFEIGTAYAAARVALAIVAAGVGRSI